MPLLHGGALPILLTGVVACGVARATRTQPRTLVPGDVHQLRQHEPLLAFGPQGPAAAVALFSIINLIHFSLGARITSAHARTRVLLLSPLMIASALGFASAATGVRRPDMRSTAEDAG